MSKLRTKNEQLGAENRRVTAENSALLARARPRRDAPAYPGTYHARMCRLEISTALLCPSLFALANVVSPGSSPLQTDEFAPRAQHIDLRKLCQPD